MSRLDPVVTLVSNLPSRGRSHSSVTPWVYAVFSRVWILSGRIRGSPRPEESLLDFFEVVHSQRSIRRFNAAAVSEEAIWQIIDAAIRAPSGSNTQPWGWLIVQDAAKREAIAQAVRSSMSDLEETRRGAAQLEPSEQRMLLGALAFIEDVASAPVLIIPCLVSPSSPTNDINSLFAGSSIYGAVQNMMLSARAIGLGTVLTTLNMAIEDTIRSLFELPEDAKPVALIPLGYPDGQRFGPTTRKPVESVTYWDRWGAAKNR